MELNPENIQVMLSALVLYRIGKEKAFAGENSPEVTEGIEALKKAEEAIKRFDFTGEESIIKLLNAIEKARI